MQSHVKEPLVIPTQQDPQVMSGAVVFAGTRVPVQTLFDYILDGYDIAEFLEQFPSVTHDQIHQVLRVAQASLPVVDAAS